jgi:hypothetical protein
MLSPAEVVPFLLHEDGSVREHALEYLADGHDPGPATGDDVWTAIDRYGDEPSRYATSQRAVFAAKLPCFPATERSTERLLDALRAGPAPAEALHLIGAARELAPAVLRRLLEDDAIRTGLTAETVAEIADDLVLAETGFDTLWDELRICTVELGDAGTLESPMFRRAQRLVRAISRSPEQAAARGLEILSGTPATEPAASWMELFAVKLFDRVRYRGPLAPLLRILGEEGDYTNERAVDALVHVGTPEVVATIEARLADSTDPFQVYATSAIARIRRPESEAALIRQLEPEDNLYRRTELAMFLLELCMSVIAKIEGVQIAKIAGRGAS